MIEIINLSKTYKNNIVLNNVNVVFEEGKIYGIIGRNGSGKTTLFKLISGLVKLSEGKILINGKILGQEIDRPESIGLILETPGFLLQYSGFENLKYLAKIKNIVNANEIKNTMHSIGLNPDNKKKVSNYSLGMKQKLGIAQAIMETPDILILDEPLNSLDEESAEKVIRILKNFRDKGKTILIASHIIDEIDKICDIVYKISNGNLQKLLNR